MYMYIYVYVFVYIYVYIYTYMYLFVFKFTYAHGLKQATEFGVQEWTHRRVAKGSINQAMSTLEPHATHGTVGLPVRYAWCIESNWKKL